MNNKWTIHIRFYFFGQIVLVLFSFLKFVVTSLAIRSAGTESCMIFIEESVKMVQHTMLVNKLNILRCACSGRTISSAANTVTAAKSMDTT